MSPADDEQPGTIGVDVRRLPDDCVVVKIGSELQQHKAAVTVLRAAMTELRRSPALLVIDLSNVASIDRHSIDVLTTLAAEAGEADISFCLVAAPDGPVTAALAEARKTELFEIFSSVSEAREEPA